MKPALPVWDPPQFDLTECGKRIAAERRDEPGAEQFHLYGYGDRDYDIFADGPTGNWAWKPFRDRALGENFRAHKPAPHLRFCATCRSCYCSCPA